MLITAVGLAGLLTIAVDTPYWQLALWQLIIGAGSGLFNSPNTSAVMGVIPPNKRGIGAGMRAMLTSTGFVISIALAIGLMTSAMDPKVLVAVFSGTQTGTAGIDLGPFINALHIAFAGGRDREHHRRRHLGDARRTSRAEDDVRTTSTVPA